MNFLEQLGLGVGTAMGGQFAHVPYPHIKCLHQDCPICAEEDRKKIKDAKFAELERKKKEEDYKDRCDKYMKWYRTKYKKGGK